MLEGHMGQDPVHMLIRIPPLGLLTTVKPPALYERYDFSEKGVLRFLALREMRLAVSLDGCAHHCIFTGKYAMRSLALTGDGPWDSCP